MIQDAKNPTYSNLEKNSRGNSLIRPYAALIICNPACTVLYRPLREPE